MSVDDKDSVTMIGMHTLASLTEDGLLPGLQALVSRRTDQWTFRNVVTFPREMARASGEAPKIALGRDAESGENVIAFAERMAGISGKSRKA